MIQRYSLFLSLSQKQLSDHPHIVQFVAAAGCPPTMTSHGSAEFLIQTELCSGECVCGGKGGGLCVVVCVCGDCVQW